MWHVDDTGRVTCSLFSSCAGPFWQYFLWQCPDAEGVVGRRRKKKRTVPVLPPYQGTAMQWGSVCGKVCARETVIFGSAQKWHSRESWTLTAKKRMGAWCHSDMRKNDIFSFYVSSKDFHTRIMLVILSTPMPMRLERRKEREKERVGREREICEVNKRFFF